MSESGTDQGAQNKGKVKRHLLTPRQVTIAFKKILKEEKEKGCGDPERTHVAMDALMVETLRLLGYDNAMTVFEDSTR